MTDPRSAAQRLSGQFVSEFGGNVGSVVLFGSVARGEAIPGVSDVNVLIVLRTVTPPVMAAIAKLADTWIRSGNTPPLLLSEEEWDGIGDAFAIEISDMLDAREIIHGRDAIAGLAPSRSELRLHTEREMRQMVLSLRSRMVLAADDPGELGRLLMAGLPSFSSYARATLRLAGQRPPMETEMVFERTGALIHADTESLLRCQEARRGIRPIQLPITDPTVAGYLDFARQLMTHVDSLTPDGPLPVHG